MEFTKENVIKLVNDCIKFLSEESQKALTRIEEEEIIRDYLKGRHDTLNVVCMLLHDVTATVNEMITTEDLIDKENR